MPKKENFLLSFYHHKRLCVGTKNYHSIQYCRKFKDQEAKRECIDCDPLEDGSNKMYSEAGFLMKHNRGTMKRHQYYYIIYDKRKPAGVQIEDPEKTPTSKGNASPVSSADFNLSPIKSKNTDNFTQAMKKSNTITSSKPS